MLTHVDGKRHVLEMKDVTLDDTCQIKAEAKGIPSMANLTVIGNQRSSSLFFCNLCPHVSVCLCYFMFVTRNRFFTVVHVSYVTVESFVCPAPHFCHVFKKLSPFQREMRTSRLNSRTILLWRKTLWF